MWIIDLILREHLTPGKSLSLLEFISLLVIVDRSGSCFLQLL